MMSIPVRLSLLAMMILLPFAAQAQQPNTPGETEKLCKEDCEKSCMGNDTPTERAKCLERENCGTRPACPTKGRGASLFIRRGMDEIRIKCADSEFYARMHRCRQADYLTRWGVTDRCLCDNQHQVRQYDLRGINGQQRRKLLGGRTREWSAQ